MRKKLRITVNQSASDEPVQWRYPSLTAHVCICNDNMATLSRAQLGCLLVKYIYSILQYSMFCTQGEPILHSSNASSLTSPRSAGQQTSPRQEATRTNTQPCHTVRKFIWWRYCIALCDVIYDLFSLFDESLRHIELCNSVFSQIEQNLPQLF